MLRRNDAAESTRNAAMAVFLAAGLASAALADTRPVVMKFSDPGNVEEARVTIQFEDTAKPDGDPRKYRYVLATIPPDTNAQQKRDIILSRLEFNGFTVRSVGNTGLVLSEIDSKVKVHFSNGGTMESDVITCQAPTAGGIVFEGVFDPFTPAQQPAIFTAGIVTDLGECSVAVSAAELNFQTDGPIICQALCQRLAPRALELGAQVNYAGDRLEVYFDPAYTATQGGVQWGTDSPSEGCGGTLTIEYPELGLYVGDLRIGQPAVIRAQGAEPAERIYFCYGFSTGDLFVPQLNITLDLAAPVLVGSALADPLGQAQLTLPIPPNPRLVGLELVWQAVAVEKVSQVVPKTIR